MAYNSQALLQEVANAKRATAPYGGNLPNAMLLASSGRAYDSCLNIWQKHMQNMMNLLTSPDASYSAQDIRTAFDYFDSYAQLLYDISPDYAIKKGVMLVVDRFNRLSSTAIASISINLLNVLPDSMLPRLDVVFFNSLNRTTVGQIQSRYLSKMSNATIAGLSASFWNNLASSLVSTLSWSSFLSKISAAVIPQLNAEFLNAFLTSTTAALSASFLNALNLTVVPQLSISFLQAILPATWAAVKIEFYSSLSVSLSAANMFGILNYLSNDRIAGLGTDFLNRFSQETIDMMINTPSSLRTANFADQIPVMNKLTLDVVKYRALIARLPASQLNALTADRIALIGSAYLNVFSPEVRRGLSAYFFNSLSSAAINNLDVNYFSVDMSPEASRDLQSTFLSYVSISSIKVLLNRNASNTASSFNNYLVGRLNAASDVEIAQMDATFLNMLPGVITNALGFRVLNRLQLTDSGRATIRALNANFFNGLGIDYTIQSLFSTVFANMSDDTLVHLNSRFLKLSYWPGFTLRQIALLFSQNFSNISVTSTYFYSVSNTLPARLGGLTVADMNNLCALPPADLSGFLNNLSSIAGFKNALVTRLNSLLSTDVLNLSANFLNGLSESLIWGLSANFLNALSSSVVSQLQFKYFYTMDAQKVNAMSAGFFNAVSAFCAGGLNFDYLCHVSDAVIPNLSVTFLNTLNTATVRDMIANTRIVRPTNFSSLISKNKCLSLDGAKYRALIAMLTVNDLSAYVASDFINMRADALNVLAPVTIQGLSSNFLASIPTVATLQLSDNFISSIRNQAIISYLSNLTDPAWRSQFLQVQSIVISGAGIANGTGSVKLGSAVILTMVLNRAMSFTGTGLTLSLNNGGVASYVRGNGTSTLVFQYIVSNAQNTADLTVSSFNLNGVSGRLPNVASAVINPTGTLIVDTIAPTMQIVSSKSLLGVGDVATLTFVLSETLVRFSASDISVIGGNLSSFTGSGTRYTANFVANARSTISATVGVLASGLSDVAGNIMASAPRQVMSVDTTKTSVEATLTQFINASASNKGSMINSMNALFNNLDAFLLFDVNQNLLKNSLVDQNASGLSADFLNNISPIIFAKLQNAELSADFFNNLSVATVIEIGAEFISTLLNAASTTLISSIGSTFFQNVNTKTIWSLSPSETKKLQPVLAKLLPDAILGLSVEQSSGLSFTGSVKPISLLNATQLRQVSVDSIQKISGVVLAELAAPKLANLSIDSLLNLTADQITSLSKEQIDAITAIQVPALLMTIDQLKNLVVTRLTPATISALVPQQFLSLLPNVRNLSLTQTAGISYEVLNELNDAQLHSFSQDQLLSLNPATLSLLDSQTKRSLQNISTLDAAHHWNQAQINSLISMNSVSNLDPGGNLRFDLLTAQLLANRREYIVSSTARTFIEAKYQNLSFKFGAASLGNGTQQIRNFFKEAYARADYSHRHYTDSLRKAYQGTRLIGTALQIAAAVMVFSQSSDPDRSDSEQNGDILMGMAWLSASFKAPGAVLYAMYKKYGIAYVATYDAKLKQITENDMSYINAYDGVYNDIVTRLKKDPVQNTPYALTEQQINERAAQLAPNETKMAAAKFEASVAAKAALLPGIADAVGLTTITNFFKFRKEISKANGATVSPLGLRGGNAVNLRVMNVLPAGGAAMPEPVAQAVAANIDGILWRTSGGGAKTSSWIRGMIRGGVTQTVANSLALANAIYQTVEAAESDDGVAITFNSLQIIGSTLTLAGEFGPTIFQKTPLLQRRSINLLKWGQAITFTAITAYDIVESFVEYKNHPSTGGEWRVAGSLINAAFNAALLVAAVTTGGLTSVIFTLVGGLFLPNWAAIGQLYDIQQEKNSLRNQGRLIEAEFIYATLEDIANNNAMIFGWVWSDQSGKLATLKTRMNEIVNPRQSRLSIALAQDYNYAIRERNRLSSPAENIIQNFKSYITNSATADQKIISVRMLNGDSVEARNYYAANQDNSVYHNYILDLQVTANNWTTQGWDAYAIDSASGSEVNQGVVLNDIVGMPGQDANDYELVKVETSTHYGYIDAQDYDENHGNPSLTDYMIVDARNSSMNRMYTIGSNGILIKSGTGNNQYFIDGDVVTNYEIQAQDRAKNDVFITALDTTTLTVNLNKIRNANVSAFAGNFIATGSMVGQSLFVRSIRSTISMAGGNSAVTSGGRGHNITMAGGGNLVNIVLGLYLLDGTGYDHQGSVDGGAYTGTGVMPTDAYNRINFAAATQGITLDLTSTGNVTSSIASMYDLNNTTRKLDEVSFTNFQEIVGSNLNDIINISKRSDIAALTLGVGTNVVDIANSSNISIFASGGTDDIFIHNEQSTVAQNIYLHTANGESHVVLGSYARLAADLNGLSDIIDLTASATADINYIQTGSGFHKILLNQSCSGFIEMTAESRNNHTVVYEKNDQRAAGHEMVINIGSLMSQSYINYDSASALLSIYASDGSGNYLDFYAKPHDIPSTPVANTSSYASHVYVGMVNDTDDTLPMYQIDSSLLIQAMQILGNAQKTSFSFQGQNKTAFTMSSVFQETQALVPTPVHL